MEERHVKVVSNSQLPPAQTIAEKQAMENIALEYLGSGYNVCGKYANAVSIKKKIFDLNRVPSKDIRRLQNKTADFFSVVGESVEEYQKSLSVKAGIKGSYGLFSASVKTSFSSTDLSIQESSYVSIELCARYETWKLQTISTDYMFPDVLQDFETKDGKWLIEQYGGGVLMGMDLGGRWVDNLSVSKLYTESTNKISVEMEAAYGKFVSGQSSTEISDTVKNNKSIVNRRVNVIGGDPAFAPGKLEDWQTSVQENPAFMNFTADGLLMIWDLFPQYKEKLQKGFDEYVKENQIKVDKKSIISGSITEGYQYANSGGSGAGNRLSLFKPAIDSTYKYIGVNGDSNKVLVLKEITEGFGAVRKPIEWQPVWDDRGAGNDWDFNIWIPVGPPDYVALGIFCRFGVKGQGPPTEEEAANLVVVHRSLAEPCGFETTNVWRDDGTSADYSVTLGRLPHNALWPSNTDDPRARELPTTYTLKKKYIK